MTKNKHKIGILGCGYDCHNGLSERLNPWFQRPESKTDFVFSFVSAKFKEYEDLNINKDNTETENILSFLLQSKLINYLEIPKEAISESEARNLALKHLLDEKCDYVIMLDMDENYSDKDIHNILYYLNQEDNQFYGTFRIGFRNLIFDNNHYIKNFTPMRIWKVNIGDFKLKSVVYDNDCDYVNNMDMRNHVISDKEFPNKIIPFNLVNPLHYSWNDYERSCEKIMYQEKRWNPPNGNGCSLRINKEKKCIEWNIDYFDRAGFSPPEVFSI